VRYGPFVHVRAMVGCALAAVLGVATIVPAAAAAQPASVRVAVIVGPAGEATARYRQQAEAAAVEAERWTSQVVRVYSPDATWSAARRAMQGASIVIYLGHGNGWPSPYRSSPYPRTQNGLGLNPVAGVDDVAHQYFGESYLARDVRLAPGAVVLLHHLCYASGTSEPGRPEGSLDTAVQRVDNYAAGFLRAGATAVLADALTGPAPYVRALFEGRKSLVAAWRGAATAQGNVVSFASTRTPGFTALLDPRQPASGFFRSLVLQRDVAPGAISSGAGASGSEPLWPDTGPSLAALGVRIATPALGTPLVAGTDRELSIALDVPKGVSLEKGIQLGVRWTALDPAAVEPDASPSLPPTASPQPSASAPPTGSPPTALVPEPPDVSNVRAEDPGELVTVSDTKIHGGILRAAVTLPAVPGSYRLTTTLHDPDGIAYDRATQALLPALIVRVAGTLSAGFSADDEITLVSDRTVVLPVRVANTGTVAWAEAPAPDDTVDPRNAAPVPWLVGRWVRLDGLTTAVPAPATAPAFVAPGASDVVRLPITAPPETGTYLLLLDVDTPAAGSLAALGSAPALVRIIVVAPEPPTGAAPR
jgi:hypothetical protein